MKKRLVLLALMMCMTFSFVACDDSGEGKIKETQKPASATEKPEEQKEKVPLDTDPTTVEDVETLNIDIKDVNLEDYIISLGKYKGVEVEVLSTKVTKEEIEEEVKYLLESFPTYEDLDSDTAADANYVNIDYVGKIDGEEFEGGSAKDSVLLLGSNSFIDGFEDGVIGMKKGETKDLKLQFPKDYHNTTYAGKDVVFTVTLNRIMKKVETKYTDEFVKENFSEDYKLSTVDDMNKYIESAISENKKAQAESYKVTSVFEKIIDESQFKELPQQLVNYYYVNDYMYVESYANAYGVSMENYVKQSFDMTLDEYKKDTLDYAIKAVKMDIVLDAIAKTEKMEITDEYYAEEVKKIFEGYASYYEDVDAFVEANGGKEEVSKQLLLEKARDFAAEAATVVGTIDKIPQEDDKESEDKEETKEETKEESSNKENDK